MQSVIRYPYITILAFIVIPQSTAVKTSQPSRVCISSRIVIESTDIEEFGLYSSFDVPNWVVKIVTGMAFSQMYWKARTTQSSDKVVPHHLNDTEIGQTFF